MVRTGSERPPGSFGEDSLRVWAEVATELARAPATEADPLRSADRPGSGILLTAGSLSVLLAAWDGTDATPFPTATGRPERSRTNVATTTMRRVVGRADMMEAGSLLFEPTRPVPVYSIRPFARPTLTWYATAWLASQARRAPIDGRTRRETEAPPGRARSNSLTGGSRSGKIAFVMYTGKLPSRIGLALPRRSLLR